MLYETTMNTPDIPVCEAKSKKKLPTAAEGKDRGIYDIAHETKEALIEVMNMLDSFKYEIREYKCPDDCNHTEPSCFRDEMIMINELAFAVRGDLKRLIDEFH